MQIPKDEVKGRIVLAAEELFLAKGYKQTSLREVAAAAQITVGNIYHYFENKEMLFRETVFQAWIAVEALMTQNRNVFSSDCLAVIRSIGAELADVFIAHQKPLLILLRGEPGAPLAEVKATVEEVIVEHLAADKGFPYDPLLWRIQASALIMAIAQVFVAYNGDKELLQDRIGYLCALFLGVPNK